MDHRAGSLLPSITQAPRGGSTFSTLNPPVDVFSAGITDRAALPQNRAEKMIGSQSEL